MMGMMVVMITILTHWCGWMLSQLLALDTAASCSFVLILNRKPGVAGGNDDKTDGHRG